MGIGWADIQLLVIGGVFREEKGLYLCRRIMYLLHCKFENLL